MMDYSRRDFLRNSALVSGGALFLGACSSTPQSSSSGASTAGQAKLEGAQVITDQAAIPTAFKESPEFAKLVAEGKLPPVAERVGKSPLVLKPAQGIGHYGGQMRRGFIGNNDSLNAARFCSGPDTLLYWDYQFEKLVPNIAKDFELSPDGKVLTIHLREGMKWSDGHPFTADDILFWREDVSLNPDLGSAGGSLKVGGKQVKVEKVDPLTVRYTAPIPYPVLPRLMASWSDIAGMAANSDKGGGGVMPKHYLSQFHPKYTSQAAVNKLAKDAGFSGWVAYFKNQASWHRNTKLPTLAPWIVTRPANQPPWEFAANPYSIWVDTEGNQLPYISKISMSNVENPEVLGLRAASGDYDFQDRHLGVTNLPVLVENEKRSNYTVHRSPSKEVDCGIRLNLAYDKDKELGDLIRNVDFRRALSLGVNRQEINESFFLGTCTPTATMASDDSPYFPGSEWRTKWATHDVEQANALLDKIGLTKKDSAGYRLRRDGKGRIRMDFQSSAASFADFVGISELIKRHWQPIGIDANVQSVDGTLLTERSVANQMMLSVHQVGTADPILKPDQFLPTVTNNYPGMIGIPYAKWFGSDGKKGKEPPKELQLLKDAMDLYKKGLSATDEERVRISQDLFKMHADQVWSIGLAGFGISSYGVYLASNKLKNVPGRVVNALIARTPNNVYPMTFYYE